MQRIPYAALTDAMLAQVESKFADSIFGADSSAFEYEVNDDGMVMGRISIHRTTSPRAAAITQVYGVIGVPTNEHRVRYREFIKRMMKEIIQQPAEVHHE
jgi:hypothetical protein